jgi:hypothetical protein
MHAEGGDDGDETAQDGEVEQSIDWSKTNFKVCASTPVVS